MALYRTLWQQLMALDDANRRSMLDELAAWTGVEMTPRASHRSVSQEELIELDGGPISVGGHTATHPLLPELPPERQRFEIGENKRHLEAVLDRPVDAFSYPFGAHDPSSVATARDAGYHLAVTTRPRTITTTVDRHRVGRFDVKNWTGEEFERRLRRWMWFH
jgi:peptidoglycan/xylan/chitin deacetylase (PgdA/CDA1 family)